MCEDSARFQETVMRLYNPANSLSDIPSHSFVSSLSILLFCNNEMSAAYISTCVAAEKLSPFNVEWLNQKFKDLHKNLEDEKTEKGKGNL